MVVSVHGDFLGWAIGEVGLWGVERRLGGLRCGGGRRRCGRGFLSGAWRGWGDVINHEEQPSFRRLPAKLALFKLAFAKVVYACFIRTYAVLIVYAIPWYTSTFNA